MVTYVIDYTDSTKTPINLEEKTVNQDLAIALFGRQKLEYGELMNENILHLLENFACPEDPSVPGNPYLAQALDHTLQNAVNGQLWYNSTNELLYVRSNGVWVPLSMFGEVAANYGTIAHGEQLPLPVSNTGYIFTYAECSWMVGPNSYPDQIDYMRCYTNTDDSRVTMQYVVAGDPTLIAGTANYMIIGIRDNNNLGLNPVNVPPALTNTPTPAATLTPTPTRTVTPSPTASIGQTPTLTPTGTPFATGTPTVTPTNTVTPTTTVTPTNTQTQTPAATIQPLGLATRLFASPTTADPGVPGPGSGETSQRHSCGGGVTLTTAVNRTVYISLQNINGGVGPYTVDFSLVFIQGKSSPTSSFTYFPGDPGTYQLPGIVDTTISYYRGTTKIFSPIVTGVTANETVYMRIDHEIADQAGWYPTNAATYFMLHMHFQGRIVLTDQQGQNRLWWLPDVIPIGGSNITNPSGTGSGVLKWEWNHYYTCSDEHCVPGNPYGNICIDS